MGVTDLALADALNFLNQNAGVLATVFSGIVMLATVVYAVLTASLVTETRRMREVQTEPRIEVIASPLEEMVNIFTLRVKNIGLGPAYDVHFTLRGKSQTSGENELIKDFSRSQFLSKGLRYLGPGQALQSGYTQMHQNFVEKVKACLTVEVTYKSATGKPYADTIIIHFEEFEGYGTIGTPHLYSIAKSLEKIERNVDHLATGFRRMKVDTYSNEDRDREQDELEQRYPTINEGAGKNDS